MKGGVEMKRIMAILAVLLLVGISGEAVMIQDGTSGNLPPVSSNDETQTESKVVPLPFQLEGSFKIEALLFSQENLEFEAMGGDLVVSSVELLALKLSDADYEGLKTALEIVDEGLGMAGVKAYVSLDNKEIEALSSALRLLSRAITPKTEIDKILQHLTPVTSADRLAKVIQEGISDGTIEVQDGKISGQDLAKAIRKAFFSMLEVPVLPNVNDLMREKMELL
jgi:hypothetical protein